MSGTPPVEEGSLVARAMVRVRTHIASNGLGVGDALPSEERFATDLGVSRAVMREAFGKLAALRLIDVGNGRRARVGAIDGSVIGASLDHAVVTNQVSLPEIWDVRRTLELRTAELAAAHRKPNEAERILAHARGLANARTMDEVTAHDIALHQSVAAASGNPLYHQIVRSFEPMMRRAIPLAWETRVTEDQRRTMRVRHLDLAEAIVAREPERARATMNMHFDETVVRAAGRAA